MCDRHRPEDGADSSDLDELLDRTGPIAELGQRSERRTLPERRTLIRRRDGEIVEVPERPARGCEVCGAAAYKGCDPAGHGQPNGTSWVPA